jgi:hypothetical protein
MPDQGTETGGCTVGVIHIPGGILFFKNRDMRHEYLVNRLAAWQSTPHVHALKGANLKTGELEGIAIGVNRCKICVANTHIVSTPDSTYDILCERLIQEARTQRDIPGIVKSYVAHHRVQGGRILVSSPTWTFLVEVLGDRFEIREIEGNFVITNSFSLIPYEAEKPQIRKQSSASRLQVASQMVDSIRNMNQLKSMLRSHVPDKGDLSICSHWQDGGGTESSHIVQICGEYTSWTSLVGFPCENDYQTVQLFSGSPPVHY